MNTDAKIKAWYGQDDMLDNILRRIGKRDGLTTADLAPYDELHIGRRKATLHLVNTLGFRAGMRVLDAGSGLGGAARVMAETTGASVVGIDLTPEFCATAGYLSDLSGFGDRTSFITGSVLDMPFPEAWFDGAYTIHVSMNIRNKVAFYGEVARVLKPGSLFGLYDVMKTEQGALTYPMPWADNEDTRFPETPDTVRLLLEQAGFEIISVERRHDFALEQLRRMREQKTESLIPNFAVRAENLYNAVESGACSPWQMIGRRL
jgi:ubiquinone/menaquinone biosynthesis C-methylase UbiE